MQDQEVTMAGPEPTNLEHRMAAKIQARQRGVLVRLTRFVDETELRVLLGKVFSHFDADNSGQITTSELDDLLMACGIKVSPQKLESMMREADSDGSGAIKFDEFYALVKKDKDRKDNLFHRVILKSKVAVMANKSYTKMHVRHRALKAAKAVASGAAVTATDGQVDLAIWQQGDAELSTDENLARREQLRRHPEVVEALNTFFESVVKAQLRARLASEGPFEKISGDGVTFITITADTDLDALLNVLDTNVSADWLGYFAVFIRIYKVLLSEEDNEDAAESIAGDWEEDRNGQPYMSREALQNSLFELVDVWTESISGAEYAKFIWDLIRLIIDENGAWRPVESLSFRGEDADSSHADAPRNASGSGRGVGNSSGSSGGGSGSGSGRGNASGSSGGSGRSARGAGESRDRGHGQGRDDSQNGRGHGQGHGQGHGHGNKQQHGNKRAHAPSPGGRSAQRRGMYGNGNGGRDDGNGSGGTPGTAGVMQRWALRTAPAHRPSKDEPQSAEPDPQRISPVRATAHFLFSTQELARDSQLAPLRSSLSDVGRFRRPVCYPFACMCCIRTDA